MRDFNVVTSLKGKGIVPGNSNNLSPLGSALSFTSQSMCPQSTIIPNLPRELFYILFIFLNLLFC